MKERDSKTTF